MSSRVGRFVRGRKMGKKGRKIRSRQNGECQISEKIKCEKIIVTEKTIRTTAVRNGGRCNTRMRQTWNNDQAPESTLVRRWVEAQQGNLSTNGFDSKVSCQNRNTSDASDEKCNNHTFSPILSSKSRPLSLSNDTLTPLSSSCTTTASWSVELSSSRIYDDEKISAVEICQTNESRLQHTNNEECNTKATEEFKLILPDNVTNTSITTSIADEQTPLNNLKTILQDYDHSRIYLAHVFYLDWRDLPGMRSTGEESVWVLGAANHYGHHRTRLLVVGKHWRPRCFKKVNMITQPVVYAGGGKGSLTTELFLWWFHHEFATTAVALHPDGAILVAESADYLPTEVGCVTTDGLVRLHVIPRDCLECSFVTMEIRIRLAIGFLSRTRTKMYYCDTYTQNENPLEVHLRKFTLKEAFVDLHQAWLSVESETFTRIWVVMHDTNIKQKLSPNTSLSTEPHQIQYHRTLITNLWNLAREAGITVDENDIVSWLLNEEIKYTRSIKTDFEEDITINKILHEFEEEEDDDGPSAEEAAKLLSQVLLWMETEPLDPSFLLTIRSMRDAASFMVSWLVGPSLLFKVKILLFPSPNFVPMAKKLCFPNFSEVE